MAGDPARDPDPDRRQLVLPDPRAGQAVNAAGLTPNAAAVAIITCFEIAHVPVDIAAVGTQIDDGIPDELTGAVVGDVAAAAGFEDSTPGVFERLLGGQHVRAVVPDLRAERDDRRMFEEQQLVGNAAGLPRRDQLLLERKAFGVGNDAEAADFEAGGSGIRVPLRTIREMPTEPCRRFSPSPTA